VDGRRRGNMPGGSLKNEWEFWRRCTKPDFEVFTCFGLPRQYYVH
jgi:hypothetical protein